MGQVTWRFKYSRDVVWGNQGLLPLTRPTFPFRLTFVDCPCDSPHSFTFHKDATIDKEFVCAQSGARRRRCRIGDARRFGSGSCVCLLAF